MISALSSLVTGGQVAEWLVIFIIFAYFVYKEWPEFASRITKGATKETSKEHERKKANERLDNIERHLASIDERMQRDYDRLNRFEQELKKSKMIDRESREEQEIIIHSLLAIIEGLQEIGANGPTKKAQAEIMEYMTKKAHDIDDD